MGKKVVHVEFPAQDADRGQKFWEGVGGWSIQNSGMPGIDYRMFQEGDQGGAAHPIDIGVHPGASAEGESGVILRRRGTLSAVARGR